MRIYNKKAFTLAETIMTLFIVGIVITAAIPSFTLRRTIDPVQQANANSPWGFCKEQNVQGQQGGYGLCTDGPVVFPANGNRPHNTDLTLNEAANVSIYDLFDNDERIFSLGNAFFQEERDNLTITRTRQDLSSNNFSENLIIGGNSYKSNGDNGDGTGNIADVNAPFQQNTIIGNNNTFTGTSSELTIIGSNNIIGNNTRKAVIVGNAITTNLSNLQAGKDPVGIIALGQAPAAAGVPANTLPDNTLLIGSCTNNCPTTSGEYNIADEIFLEKNAAPNNPDSIRFASGDITITGTFTVQQAFQVSDERLKNIKGHYQKGLKEILQVKPVVFSYKTDNAANLHYGVVAQDLEKIFPEAVVKMPSGYLGVDKDPVFFATLNAIKEINLTTKRETQKNIELKNELLALEEELKGLTACKAAGILGKIGCYFADFKRFLKSVIARNNELVTAFAMTHASEEGGDYEKV